MRTSVLVLAGMFFFLVFCVPLRAQTSGSDSVATDPASTSLFVMPTGRTLPAGKVSVGLAAPYIPYAAVGVAEHWQVSAGGAYVFSTATTAGSEYYSYLILKHALFDDGRTSIAVGAAAMFWGHESVSGPYPGWSHVTLPGAFGVITFEGESSALTLGVGFTNIVGSFNVGLQEGLLSGFGLGYETKIDEHWKFMTEHFANVLGSGTLHTLGVRYFTGAAAFDLSLLVIPNGDVQIPTGTRIPRVLPLLGVSVRLG